MIKKLAEYSKLLKIIFNDFEDDTAKFFYSFLYQASSCIKSEACGSGVCPNCISKQK